MRKALTSAGAKVETLNYGPAPDFEARLATTDIYIWLPAGDNAVTPPEQREILAKWLDDEAGRQIHFHWVGGTVDPDGLKGVHSAEFDASMSTRSTSTTPSSRPGRIVRLPRCDRAKSG